jgi:hypothetical protein
MNITITTEHSASSYGKPVILIDGEVADQTAGVTAVYEAIKCVPIDGFLGLPTTLAEQHDPAAYVKMANAAYAQYDNLQAAVRALALRRGVAPEDATAADFLLMDFLAAI